ncbi:hypothetical protein [Nocardioides piscis]|uniref:Uncharacterized protein n=1 Tax=Nocardioides piscis TaxID=2714938 RepID=A0A6G7YK07_9ACTN|nr:hypothetical protein [Nocardioides piscis]QIK77081.1 hypothetical protein G7071_18215 [Nocardioides piscis]
MSGDVTRSAADRVTELERELQLARREVKWVCTDQEHLTEALQRVRRQRAKLRDQSESLATALAAELSAAYWREQKASHRRVRLRAADPEATLVREVESSPLFDAGWYLRQHQRTIIEHHLAPAVHYVRHANERRLDPSEGFSTDRYLLRHPEARDSGVPALVHALRNGLLEDGLVAPGSLGVEVSAED